MSQAWSAATAPSAIQTNSGPTASSSTAAATNGDGTRAYSDPTELMEKRKRCCERAERMRKAYRRRLREGFGRCLSESEATAVDLGSPASHRLRQGDEDLNILTVSRSVKQDSSDLAHPSQMIGTRLQAAD